ncbi:MAG: glutaredoxin family protein [Candidatus Aquirickettsiella gammari]
MSEISSHTVAKFTLYSRTYCHLCDDMLEQLKAHLNDTSVIIDVVDVDADEALVARFDELVPVLFAQKIGQEGGQEAQQICHYFLDVEKLKAFLHD